jgi:hypothetical protein
MSERYDHRDDEARAQDATSAETVSAPVMDGAGELREDAEQAMAEENVDGSSEAEGEG